jgi:hypothetical protein
MIETADETYDAELLIATLTVLIRMSVKGRR